MSAEMDQLAGGWALTGFAWLAGGLWVAVTFAWPLLPLGVLLVAHGVRSLRLSHCLVSGQNDPRGRKALAQALAFDAAVLVLVGAGTLVTRR